MSIPLGRPITYDELRRLPDDGRQYELYDGVAVVNPSPFWPHQDFVLRLAVAFKSAIRDGSKVFVAPLDVVLSQRNVLQPDLLLVREQNINVLRDVVRGVPDLVVEVISRGTATRDRAIKKRMYARFGVPEYWLADLERRTIEIRRLRPSGRSYRLAATLRPGDRATTPLLPELNAEVAALFGE